MVLVVGMIDAAFSWVILPGDLGCSSAGTWAAMSTAMGWPGADGPSRRSTTGPSTSQAGILLDLSAHSSARARVQLVPYGSWWPL